MGILKPALFGFLFFVFPPLCSAVSTPEIESCVTCHRFQSDKLALPVVEWQSSTHQIEGITCSACHGGDPNVKLGELDKLSPEQFRSLVKQSMYDSPDFVGKPALQAQFDLCANCHADDVATYKNSIMGAAYLSQKGGPSCVQCHGAHYNKIPEVPASCKDCHADVTGYDQITAMDVSERTIDQLYEIRTQLALTQVHGKEVPWLPENLESYQIGLLTFGVIALLLIFALVLYRLLERRR